MSAMPRLASPLPRRRWLRHAATALALPAVLPAVSVAAHAAAPAAAGSLADPAKGERVNWPERISLLDGRALSAPAPGGPASVVVFFSTTCPFCARHNVHVQKLLDTTRGQALRVLGVAHDKREQDVRTYLTRRGLGFDVSLDRPALQAALTRMPGIPITVVVDRQQRLREVIRGEMFEEDVLELAKWARG